MQKLWLAPLALAVVTLPSCAQTDAAPTPAPAPAHHGKHAKRSPGGDVGSGAGDLGKGVGKGAGALAKGTGKGAVDLATLHPINAATDLGRGGAAAGGHLAVGTVKGTGKIAKGTGRAIRKLF